jgi:hypothetical protein
VQPGKDRFSKGKLLSGTDPHTLLAVIVGFVILAAAALTERLAGRRF